MTKKRVLLALLLVFALVAAACGDDDDGGGATEPNGTDQTTAAPSEEEGEPVQGGEATLLFWAEQTSLDPVRSNPTSGSTGLRDFALYGALVATDPETLEVETILAESLEPNDTFDTWTLKIREGVTFSDGSTYNAAAVKAHWDRIAVPENRSSAITFVRSVASATPTDELTLEIELVEPNALFDRLIARSAMNYIPSQQAIESGQDLTNEAVGAGPFLLDSWFRDDRMVLVRNPNWIDAPQPYLDKLTIRVITDEEQRLDTLLTGDADANYTITAGTVARGEAEGLGYEGVAVMMGSTINFNLSKPPFDDPELRRAIAMAVDYQALIEAADGEGAVAPYNYTTEDSPWFSEEAALPEYDPEQAQEMINDYLERTGQTEISVNMVTTQSPRNIAMGKFMQTSLDQLEGVNIQPEPGDQPTLLQKVFALEFGLASWGFPTLLPDPDLYQGIFSTSSANTTGYKSAEVDAFFTEARSLGDPEDRNDIYTQLFQQLAEDIPFIPFHSRNGWLTGEGFHVGELYQEGIIRTDLAWIEP
jgi:peptide/nickel transport system substrate-binding protein